MVWSRVSEPESKDGLCAGRSPVMLRESFPVLQDSLPVRRRHAQGVGCHSMRRIMWEGGESGSYNSLQYIEAQVEGCGHPCRRAARLRALEPT